MTKHRCILAVALLVAVGCEPLVGPLAVEALIQDEDSGDFRITDVTLETVTDLETGRGALFDVRGDLRVTALDLFEIGNEERYPTVDDIIEGIREESGGGDMQPRMSFDGERYVANDFDTLVYFTIFHNFELAWTFYEDVVEDRSGATLDRSVVGFYAEVAAADFFPLPLIDADNAAYLSPADAWLTLRVFLQDGVPLSMIPGVIAHEFGHRHFFHNVFKDEAPDVWRDFSTIDPNSTGDEDTRQTQLLKGVDEGLADIFAVGFSQDPNFLESALGASGDLVAYRNLEGGFAEVATLEGLETGDLPTSAGYDCGGPLGSQNFDFYCVGVVLARSLWDGAGQDMDVLRQDVLPAINLALRDVGQVIAGRGVPLDFRIEDLLEAIASRLSGANRNALCSEYLLRFGTQVQEGGVPSCL